MRRLKRLMWSWVTVIGFLSMGCQTPQDEHLIGYVNPFIGTDEDGHTFPGALVPFGMVQLSPDNGDHRYEMCSGYHYSSNQIFGFSHTHYSGTGAECLCDISLLPLTNSLPTATSIRSEFSHQDEMASPGYYSVFMKRFGIRAELTATLRCGLHRYTFPEAKQALLRLDLGFGNGAESKPGHNGDEPLECHFQKVDSHTVTGFRRSMGFVGERMVYFALQTSEPFGDVTLFAEDSLLVRGTSEARAVRLNSYLAFPAPTQGKQLLVKVSISSASVEGAMAGLDEIPDWNFDRVRRDAESAWEKELEKIRIEGVDKRLKETFYTAVYHNYFAPFRFDDAKGQYRGADGSVHQGKNIYTLHSLWDTFRATAPLYTVTQAEKVPDIIRSYLAFYEQHGLLPSWELYFGEANVMPGYHAVPVIADAMLKGIVGFDYNEAFEAMKTTANQDIRESNHYRKYGYVPDDLDPRKRGVTKTVEYAYDDWCIARVAKHLGYQEDYRQFMERSRYWRNVFDTVTCFVR
ncbi:MAG: GH92 family glycosyl hydrolase, partial [Marinilabiliales bacterium]|nr:GH92 family glycosyl hydrolase [Marinilabiliales bacterium]